MSRITLIVVGVVLVIVAGGAAFIATWEIPPPTARVEKTIPDERFRR